MDFNGDGIDDIVAGGYDNDMYFFKGLGDSKFEKPWLVRDQNGKPIKGGNSITIELADMDGDGDLDIVGGTRMSEAGWYENVGTKKEPKFSNKRNILKTKSGKAIRNSNLHFADWDSDGKRDLVVGSERGSVVWYKNIGKENRPKFADSQPLLEKKDRWIELKEGDVPEVHGSRVKVFVCDYDKDGTKDLLVGDVSSSWSYKRPPLSEEEKKEKKKLEKERSKYSKKINGEINRLLREYWKAKEKGDHALAKKLRAEQEKLREPIGKIYEKLEKFQRKKYHTHGWVWFYRGIPNKTDAASFNEQYKKP